MSIKEYHENGKSYFKVNVCIRDRNGEKHQRQKSKIETRKQAEAEERKLIRLVEAKIQEIKHQGPTWGELVEKWELSFQESNNFRRPLQKTTVIDRVNALRMYTEFWWELPVNDITRADVREVFDIMHTEGKSRARKKDIKAAMNAVFNWGIDEGLIRGHHRSPASEIVLLKESEAVPSILTINEIRSLLKLSKRDNHPWYPVWATALLTGMRSGELYALTWSDIDWENRLITVSKSYSGRLKKVKSTKAGYWRSIPINSELELLLKELILSQGSQEWVLPRLPRWHNGDAARILRQFCQGYGITSIKFHDLRACFATQLIRDGVAPAIVMKIGGWKDLKTMQRYIRLAGLEVEGATESLKLLPEMEVMGRVVDLFNGN
ncbi:MAG: site-specific integrase [Bdellovibrionaceae bacterium]|nr:site-specific integrase [Pseudobdellovibrionaceae bacterium]